MLENAKKHFSRLPNKANFVLFDLECFEESNFPVNCQAVVSSLAIHHLDDKRKCDLFKYVNTLLPENGVFVLVDVILPQCQAAAFVAAEDWDTVAYKQSVDLTGSLDAYRIFQKDKWNIYHYLDDAEYMSYDKPSSVYDHLRWLEEAGFSKVDVLWMHAGHVIFYGIK
jgi:tRNA (cmo5U34)-methyltransferase